jgi:hypothetical protein
MSSKLDPPLLLEVEGVDGKTSNIAKGSLARTDTRLMHSSVESVHIHDTHPYVTVLMHVLHHKKFHHTMITLLCFDVLCVIASIALEIEYLHEAYHGAKAHLKTCKWTYYDPNNIPLYDKCSYVHYSYGSPVVHDAHMGVAYISLTILSTFMVENLLLMFCLGRRFFKSWMSMLDLFIIGTSIGLEVVFISDPEDGALAVARTWRFARIFHGFYEYNRDHGQEALELRLKRNSEGIFHAYNMIFDETSMRHESHHHESKHATKVPQLTPEESLRIARRIYETNPELIVYLAGVAGSFLLDAEHHVRIGEVAHQQNREDGESYFSMVKERTDSLRERGSWDSSDSSMNSGPIGPVHLLYSAQDESADSPVRDEDGSGYHSAVDSPSRDPSLDAAAAVPGNPTKFENKLDEV